MSPNRTTNENQQDDNKRRLDIKDDKRKAIWACCNLVLKNGRLPHGELTKIAKYFDVLPRTVSRICTRARDCLETLDDENPTPFSVAHRKKMCGRRPKYSSQQLKQAIKAIPIKQRKTMRDSAEALGISTATFHLYVRVKKHFRPVSIATRPKLTAAHRAKCLDFVRDQIDEFGHFVSNFNRIHINEKWFYEMQDKERCYLADDEEPPHNTSRHKSHYNKVMFLAAVARPWRTNRLLIAGYTGEVAQEKGDKGWYFNGKIGLYPIVEQGYAKRSSYLRRAGEPVTISVSMKRDVYKDFIFNKLLPDIAVNCPFQMRRQTIYIQHDNAPPHKLNEEEVKERCRELGIDCEFYFQPAQSPDLNICDLSFFPAIQSLFHKIEQEKTLPAIIKAVDVAFNNYDPNNLNRAFISLQMNYNEVLKHGGCNLYKMPHMSKAKLEKRGCLPITLKAWKEGDDAVNGPINCEENQEEENEEVDVFDEWLKFDEDEYNVDEFIDSFFSTLDEEGTDNKSDEKKGDDSKSDDSKSDSENTDDEDDNSDDDKKPAAISYVRQTDSVPTESDETTVTASTMMNAINDAIDEAMCNDMELQTINSHCTTPSESAFY
jgi:hypothetical protein